MLKWANDLNRHRSKEDMKTASKHRGIRAQHPQSLGKCKTTMKNPFIPSGKTIIKKAGNHKC